jgi:hypothetical protein
MSSLAHERDDHNDNINIGGGDAGEALADSFGPGPGLGPSPAHLTNAEVMYANIEDLQFHQQQQHLDHYQQHEHLNNHQNIGSVIDHHQQQYQQGQNTNNNNTTTTGNINTINEILHSSLESLNGGKAVGGAEATVDRLFAILEDAVPRQQQQQQQQQQQGVDGYGQGLYLNAADELQRRRENEEQCWDQVRRWLWTHASPHDRAAAMLVRGHGDVTPLHLICKLNNPPTDVVTELVMAAPEVVGIPDSHGWLPLHHAAASGASTEVLELLTGILPESKLAQDNQSRTPLHFYATRNSDNPNVMAHNVALLCDTGAAQIPDRGGMIPIHYACELCKTCTVYEVQRGRGEVEEDRDDDGN